MRATHSGAEIASMLPAALFWSSPAALWPARWSCTTCQRVGGGVGRHAGACRFGTAGPASVACHRVGSSRLLLLWLNLETLQSEVPSGREASSDEGTRPPAGAPSGSVSPVSTVRSLGSASAADLLCTLKIHYEATDPGTILVQTLLCSVDHHVLLETSAYVTQPARDSARGFVELQQRLVDGIDLSCSVCEGLPKDRGYSKQGFMDFLKKPDAAATAPESQPCAAGVLAAMKGLWLGLRLSF